jgi:large subunit ribosomal protein L9
MPVFMGVVPFAHERRQGAQTLQKGLENPMRVLLLKDVYKLGRAGDVKKVADGYGRNYLLPQGLAVMATPGAMKQVERIRQKAETERSRLNQELGSLAEQLQGLKLAFAAKAGETGKLYGSITTAMIAEALKEQTGVEVDRRQIDGEPIKSLGVHTVVVRLTIDLVPEVTVLVHREGEPPESAYEAEPTAEFVPEFSELIEAEQQAEREAQAEEELAVADSEAEAAESS